MTCDTIFETMYYSLGEEYKKLKKALEKIEDLEGQQKTDGTAQRIAREALE